MKKNFINLVTAGSAIKQLVSNVEGTDYDFSFIPVDVKLSNRMEHFQMFVIYKKDDYDKVVNEINEKMAIDVVDSFLKPSENYVQIAFYESDDTPNYKRSITFGDNDEKLQKYEVKSCIVDENYQYINTVMNSLGEDSFDDNNSKSLVQIITKHFNNNEDNEGITLEQFIELFKDEK